MEVLNFNEFKKNLTKNLNKISDDEGIVVVSSINGKKVVVMALEEYNSIQETLYITKSAANHNRLDEAIVEMEKGIFKKHSMSEK